MSKRADLAYLQDILDAGEYIGTYLAGMSFEAFCPQVRRWLGELRGEP